MKCKVCNADIVEGANFCLMCGAKVERELFCSQCGTKLPDGSRFCSGCGAAVKADSANAVKQPAKQQESVEQPETLKKQPEAEMNFMNVDLNNLKSWERKIVEEMRLEENRKSRVATHSERIIGSYDRPCIYHDDVFWRSPFNKVGDEHGDFLYLLKGDKVYKFKSDTSGDMKVIESDSKYFRGDIAVNCHGIFRRPQNSKSIYLFDENGNQKSKVTLKANKGETRIDVPNVYIFDNFIYDMYTKSNDLILYRYDIIGGEEEILWSYKENVSTIFEHCNKYIDQTNINRRKFQLGGRVALSKLCANEKYVIIGVDIGNKGGYSFETRSYMSVLMRFDMDTHKKYILNIAYIENRKGRENLDLKALAVDMKDEKVLFARFTDNGKVKLECRTYTLEGAALKYRTESYDIPEDIANYLEYGYEAVYTASMEGSLVVLKDTLTGYIYDLGEEGEYNPRKISNVYQSNEMEVLGADYAYFGMNNYDSYRGYIFLESAYAEDNLYMKIDFNDMKAEVRGR